MNLLRRKYFIYPEIQRPLMKQIAFGLCFLGFLQIAGIMMTMAWMQAVSGADLSIVIDQRVLGTWKYFLFLSIGIPVFLNLIVGLMIVLYVSNRFAGPLFRLEKEIDSYLKGEKNELIVKFRNNDYLHSLSEKVNKLMVKQK